MRSAVRPAHRCSCCRHRSAGSRRLATTSRSSITTSICSSTPSSRAERNSVMDLTVLEFLAAPSAASLILTGIHAYLGVHVVERGVVFVDLSLAQIAALGATFAILLPVTGGDPHAPVVYWISLAFTFVGAFV